MDIPFRNNNAAGGVPQGTGRRIIWWRVGVAAVAGIALLFGLFAGGRWVYRKVSDHGPAMSAPSSISGGSKKQSVAVGPAPKTPNLQGSSPSVQQPPAPSSAPGPSASQKPQSPASTQPTDQQLANSGPGSTALIFLGASAAGAFGYQAVLRRRIRA